MSHSRKHRREMLAELRNISSQLATIVSILRPPAPPPLMLVPVEEKIQPLVNYGDDSDDEEPPVKKICRGINTEITPEEADDDCSDSDDGNVRLVDYYRRSNTRDRDAELKEEEMRPVDYYGKNGENSDHESDDDYVPLGHETSSNPRPKACRSRDRSQENLPYSVPGGPPGLPAFQAYRGGIIKKLRESSHTTHLKSEKVGGGGALYFNENTGNAIEVKFISDTPVDRSEPFAKYLRVESTIGLLNKAGFKYQRLLIILFAINGTDEQNHNAIDVLARRICLFSNFRDLASRFMLYVAEARNITTFARRRDSYIETTSCKMIEEEIAQRQAREVTEEAARQILRVADRSRASA